MSENKQPKGKPDRGTLFKVVKGKRTIFAVVCGIVITLAILSFSNWITKPNRNNPNFSYGPDGNQDNPINIIYNYRTEVPITFNIDPGIPEVVLEFSGEHAKLEGISLHDHSVRVIDGKASSKVIILFNRKPNLKAGTHYLTVIAKNPKTGTVIRMGKIMFNYNMHEVIRNCSC